MSTVDTALKAARQAWAEGSAAVTAANDQLAALRERRAAVEIGLQEARADVKSASAALVGGGSEKVFDQSMLKVERLQAQLRTFDEDVIPAAEAACAQAAQGLPADGIVQTLELRAAALERLCPLYERHDELVSALAALLGEVDAEIARLRAEFRTAWLTLFGAARNAELKDLLQAVPPPVRAVYRLLFVDQLSQPVHEDRFLSFAGGGAAPFRERVDQEPSGAELAKYNPAAGPPAPPFVPEPPPELGPAKMAGMIEHRMPGTSSGER